MKKNINELTSYKDSEVFQKFTELKKRKKNLLFYFMNFLKEQGYKELGSGSFGLVFTHPKIDYAIKIFANDRGYLRFLKYALANQSNQHLPKFRGKFMKIDGSHYVVRMEKLEPLKISDMYSNIIHSVNMFVRSKYSIKKFKEKYPIDKEILDSQPGLIETLDSLNKILENDYFDIKYENIMQRKDGNVVITDPFC